jgi:hypothetical protein
LGAENVVTVVVHNVPPGEFSSLQSQIREAVEGQVSGHAATVTGGTMRMALGPVGDAAALARRLPFGKVTNVNLEVRMIVVELPPPTMK